MSYSYTANGSLNLSDSASCSYSENSLVLLHPYISSDFGYNFIKSLDFSWDVIQTLEAELDVSWDIGDEKLYWYTVEGICKVESGCSRNIPSGSKGRIYSRTVAAKNLSDLCFKLKTLHLNYPVDWPITKIIRYKNPVYLDDIIYEDDTNVYSLLENNNIVKTTPTLVESFYDEELINSTQYSDKFTIILPDFRKVVKNFKDGILNSVDVIEPNGITKNYKQNTVAIVTNIPSTLVSINYKISKQIKSLDLLNNSAIIQQYCHIPECLSFCINEDLLINIGCKTEFTDAFYNYESQGGLELSGRFITNNLNEISFSGGLAIGGSSLYSNNYFNYTASGFISLESSSSLIFENWNYTPINYQLSLVGNANAEAENLSYTASGNLSLSGNPLNKLSFNFLVKNPIISFSGSSSLNYNNKFIYNPLGSLNFDYNFDYNCVNHSYVVDSGFSIGDSFIVKSNRRNYIMDSGFDISGNSLIHYKVQSSGSLNLQNSFLSSFKTETFSSGTLILGSSAFISSSNFSYVFDGGFDLSSTFETNLINDLDLLVNMGASVDLVTYEPILPEQYGPESGRFSFENGFVNNYNCGCNPIPVRLYLINNLTNSKLLSDFLNRNNLTLNDNVDLSYSLISNSWKNNFYFNSVNNLEKWMIIYDWSCSILDSSNVWNLSIKLSRELNGIKKNSNFMFMFDQTEPCNNDVIDFNFIFNTNNKNIVSPNGLNVLKYIIKDEIGLFKDKNWINTSLLKISISEVENINNLNRKDIFSIFPN